MRHIELFAGCGGMSLGLESAGFELYMANELSPMAGETFAYNLLGENLNDLSKTDSSPDNVLWVKSKYKSDNLKDRLRENPFQYSSGRNADISNKTDFEGKLLIGNVDHFLKFLAHNKSTCQKFRKLNIDLLSGGPPCQGFSLAGKRVKDDHKNLLPLSFARFAGLLQPKVVLLENVKGITSPFTADDGVKYYAWLEIAKAFAIHGFVPVCMLLNSKYFGVPQNRPRFILLAFRKDIFNSIKFNTINSEITQAILANSLSFFQKANSKRKNLSEMTTADIKMYDIDTDAKYFDGYLLPKITTYTTDFLSAEDAIDDITRTDKMYDITKFNRSYPTALNKRFKPKFHIFSSVLQNHETRNHRFSVRARFRFYQIISKLNGVKSDAVNVITGKNSDLHIVEKVYKAIKSEPVLIKVENGVDLFDTLKDLDFFVSYLRQIESKKHSQRAIKANEPAPAQLTIPDDLCHYSVSELRTFTVREMARLQSFPDWFVFRSKITTGGEQRSYEVPQYTQVGNAVPPLLAYELGKTIKQILEIVDKNIVA